jgi:hypothetical protein
MLRYYFLSSIVWVILLLFRYGYQIGLGDSAEFLTFALQIKNPDLYQHDLFIQSMLSMGWNERTLFGYFFSFFSNYEWVAFIFYILLAYLMALGLQLATHKYVQNFWWSQVATGLILILLLPVDLGSNYMFYENLQGATFAKTIAVWVLVTWIYNYRAVGIVLLIPATFLHPLIGFQLFLAYSTAYIVYAFSTRDKTEIKFSIGSILLYFCFAGWFVGFIFLGQRGEGASVSVERFMDLTYRFTLYCHYVPHYFSKKGFLLHLLLLGIAIPFFKSRNKPLYYFLLTLAAGYIIYLFGFYVLNNYLIISSWWFRTTVWLKLLGVIASVTLLEAWIKNNYAFLSKIIPAVLIGIILSYSILNKADLYMFPWNDNTHLNDELDMADACKKLTDQNAVFIQPYEFTALKYHGQRSSYVEPDRILRRRKDITIWYNRLGSVYGLYDTKQFARNPAFKKDMAASYKKLKEEDLIKYKSEGVNYMIIYADMNFKNAKLLYKNNTYQLLKL